MQSPGTKKILDRLRAVAVSAVLAVLAPPAALAAGFDCGKAIRPVEKLICADAEASRLDGQLAGEYLAALAAAEDPGALRRSQRAWLKVRDNCGNAECLRAVYAERIAALERVQSPGRERPGGREYAEADLRQSCVPARGEAVGPGASYRECRLRDLKAVGEAGGMRWYAAEYCLAPGDITTPGCSEGARDEGANETAVLLFSRQSPDGPLRLQLEHRDADGNRFAGARIHANEHGSILAIPFSVPGTGNLNASAYYLWRNGAWRQIDFESWQKDMHQRLPKGLGVWKGPWPDLQKMTFESPLWKDGDGNCCPSGGAVRASLGLDGTRLVIRSMSVDRRP